MITNENENYGRTRTERVKGPNGITMTTHELFDSINKIVTEIFKVIDQIFFTPFNSVD